MKRTMPRTMPFCALCGATEGLALYDLIAPEHGRVQFCAACWGEYRADMALAASAPTPRRGTPLAPPLEVTPPPRD